MEIFPKSEIIKISLQKIHAEKLDPPSKDSALKVGIGVGLSFNEIKTDLGYEVKYDLTISCEEDDEPRLCKLEYTTKVTYAIEGDSDNIEKKFQKENSIFLRELYSITVNDLNNILYNMKVKLQLPLSLPDGFVLKEEKATKE